MPGTTQAPSASPAPAADRASITPPQEVPSEPARVTSEPGATAVPAALPRTGIHVRLEAVQTCWASVFGDGKPLFSRELNPGEDRSFDAAVRISIVLGNAGGIRLTINDKPARPLGKPGQVVKVILTERNIPDFLEPPAGRHQ
jgi:hypothetical protein